VNVDHFDMLLMDNN